jgi:BMFP domain-containing protein YqiC
MDFDSEYELLQRVRKKLEKIEKEISDLLDEIHDA